MNHRRTLAVASYVWAAIGVVIGIATVGQGGPVVLRVAQVGGPAMAVLAGRLLQSGRARLGGAALVVSAIGTPTFFFYAINFLVLAGGLALAILGEPERRPVSAQS